MGRKDEIYQSKVPSEQCFYRTLCHSEIPISRFGFKINISVKYEKFLQDVEDKGTYWQLKR